MGQFRPSNILIKNKRAYFDYELVDQFVAGIVLVGTEIKSIRLGKASLVDSFCYFVNGELWVKNINISTYLFGNLNNHETRRERKLLLTKKELRRLQRDSNISQMTIVPIKLYINESGYAKLVISLARGKKEYDKRHSLKDKDDRKQIDRMMKNK